MTAEIKSSIAVIVVNYGTADLSIEAVESVLAHQHGGHPVEVHLVDNASPGDDAARFAQAHDERGWGDRVTLWLERENHGFGRGNNVALHALAQRETPPDYFFLLNPDATLNNEALAVLSDFMDARPGAMVAGARIERPDGRPVQAVFRFPDTRSEFASAVCFGPITRLFEHPAFSTADGPIQVDWVSGAAVMFRFATARDVGFFDPDFFLYFEETELIWRMHQQGEVWFVPDAVIGHIAGAATGMQEGRHRTKAQPGYWYDSWRLYFAKTRGVGGARRAALARYLGTGMNAVLRGLTGKSPDAPTGFWKDFTGHVMRPLFGGDPLEARPDGRTLKADWLRKSR
ncbi:glycosyltransferase family 2 protein [Paenirhodobacter populi]|nr:glycosyltransferase family 2 protein [Sinirhodobacter populi]